MKKFIPDWQYRDEFREAMVSQVLESGRPIRQVARCRRPPKYGAEAQALVSGFISLREHREEPGVSRARHQPQHCRLQKSWSESIIFGIVSAKLETLALLQWWPADVNPDPAHHRAYTQGSANWRSCHRTKSRLLPRF